jgi:hypothetical protein
MKWLLVFFSLICTAAHGQFNDRVRFQVAGIAHNQQLRETDTGGYFIGDRYTRRLNLGINFSYDFANQWTALVGVQSVTFVADVNFRFANNLPNLNSRVGALFCLSYLAGAERILIKRERWRIGLQGRYHFTQMDTRWDDNLSEVGSTSDPYSRADYVTTFKVLKRNFHSLGLAGFVRFRLLPRTWLTYDYGYLLALNSAPVMQMDIAYEVTNTGSSVSQAYQAQTRSMGSARQHTFGFQFVF